MFVTDAKELLLKAKKGGYAIPAYDYIDLDSCRVLCQAAEKVGKPLILSYAEVLKDTISIEEAALIGKYMAHQYDAPIVLHLDHGQTMKCVYKAIDLGFSSVMIDASMMSFDENVAATKEIVDYAHKTGVQVEAEIGHVGSNADSEDSSNYTEPEEAARFVALTGCDSLAVSIGTSHGAYKTGIPKINFDVLHRIFEALPDTPLVLHGGSGSGDENLTRCACEGITKINIFTDLILGADKGFRSAPEGNYLAAKKAANEEMLKVALLYYDLFRTE